MKNIKSYIVGMAALGAIAFTGCNMDVDPVPVSIPEASMEPNTTLLELKTKFWSDETNYIWGMENQPDAAQVTIPEREDGSHYIVHGYVCSSDDAGNVFKSLVIQDETCALAFSINTYDLYVDYRVGQEIVVDVTGLQVGKFNGLQQVGLAEWYETGRVWEASFMPVALFRSHVELNGLPDVSKVDTIQVNAFSDLPSDPDGLRRYQSQLVKFNNIKFQQGGQEKFSEYQSSGVSRYIEDAEGATLPVFTSGYSDFWNYTLPEGNGDLVCILSYFGTAGWRLILIDYAGCMNFGNPTVLPGGKDNPYTVEQAVAAEANGKKPTGWVTGYIVGTVAPEVTEISSSDDIEWTAEATLANTMVIGPDPDCKDIAKCLVMELPQDSKLREYGALRDNPDVYQRQIWVYGTLAPYMGNWGVTDNKGTVDKFRIDGVDVGGSGAPAGDGTKESPYNATQVLGGSATGTAWVTGYIVGTVTDKSIQTDAEFGTANASNTNLLIALTPEVTDYTQCVPLQLPTGAIRTALSLQQNPGNLGKVVSVYGSIEKYFGVMGVKTITEYTIEGGGDTPVTPPGEGTGTGAENDPYDVTAAISAFNAGATGTAWVEGYIVGATTDKTYDSAVFGTANVLNTNIIIAATPAETDLNKCMPIQLPTGEIRTALNLQQNPGNLGKKVKLNGSLEKYFGVPGLKTITQYVLDGADTPVTPPAGDVIFSSLSEDDQALSAGWTIDNVNLGGLEKVWSWKLYNSKGYLNASGYYNNAAVATEAYAVSPVIDLTGTTKPSLKFDHAAKFQTTLRDLCGVYARVEGTTSWTKLSIPTWPDAGAWTFMNSGNVDLTAFAGKKIQVAFKYGSSTAGADTWEIKNLEVLGEGGGQGGGNVDPNPPTPPVSGDAVTIEASRITTVPGSTTVDGYTINIEKGAGASNPMYHANTTAVRIYAKNTISISGTRMTKIVFTLASDAGYRYTTVTPSTGSISPAQASGDTSFTWVGDATEVTFTVGDIATLGTESTKPGQIRFTAIDITPAK